MLYRFEQFISAHCLTSARQGCDIPGCEWMRGVLPPLSLEAVTREAGEASGPWRWRPIERIIAAHLARRGDTGYYLWGPMTMFLRMRR